ncbi:DUF5681 domain-containing protein [Mesorhizobium sp. BR1-1-9]|uniref:DUF5681 domain-containing protein n=1 Tax=unclassified Mesorhizobium TaxID=325217 RepID=UPI001CD0AC2D|nr:MULTISPECIES: DUF5681 domain-containing protein [unclassified Mesorhizobium]MBZ9873179.1 DUF5681 domain-containing protein [Mesorhizobium sp. BR1-1-9]MBZ9945010.1 DUF5681 domain-containing protein [Mesorhizobium sp. BR1-1-13]
MKNRKKKPAEYDVGYGKPPVNSRFEKGRSGNPNGRPKGKKNVNTMLRDAFFAPIQIQQNGKTTAVTALEAIILKLRNNAIGGDYRSAVQALQLAARSVEQEESGQPGAETSPLGEQTMIELMRDYLDQKASPPRDEENDGASGGDKEDER